MKYQIPHSNGEGKWFEIDAIYPETAAEEAMERYVVDDVEAHYGLVDSGQSLRVLVMDNKGKITEWSVMAESSINYRAVEGRDG